jgi:hypothetical protein
VGDAIVGGEGHEAVLVSLTELQARLRGDPATYRRPVVGREIFAVTYDDAAPEGFMDVDRPVPDLRELTDRLLKLERELTQVLDGIESKLDDDRGEAAPSNVVSLQRAIEARLSAD